jgi:hypothetical protein
MRENAVPGRPDIRPHPLGKGGNRTRHRARLCFLCVGQASRLRPVHCLLISRPRPFGGRGYGVGARPLIRPFSRKAGEAVGAQREAERFRRVADHEGLGLHVRAKVEEVEIDADRLREALRDFDIDPHRAAALRPGIRLVVGVDRDAQRSGGATVSSGRAPTGATARTQRARTPSAPSRRRNGNRDMYESPTSPPG